MTYLGSSLLEPREIPTTFLVPFGNKIAKLRKGNANAIDVGGAR